MRVLRLNKEQIFKGIYYVSVFFLASGFSYVAFANPPATTYAPGATLDPSCAPGSTNCTVSTTTASSGSDGYIQFSTSGTLGSDSGFFWDNTNKRLGIGTSTPYASLSVSGQIVGGYFTGTTTATSTFGGNLAISGTGTSTSNGGFDISAGCYAINGTCIGGGVSTNSAGGTGAIQFANGTAFAGDATNLFWNNSTKRLGIGAATPAYSLDVSGDANIAAGSAYRYNGINIANASTTLNNYFFGGAGNLTMTGSYNTATGYSSLLSNITGIQNSAYGMGSLQSNTSGSYNTANGFISLAANTSGSYNTANGVGSLQANTSGSYNIGNGAYSLYANTTGGYNTVIGYDVFSSNLTGNGNIAFGYHAGYGDSVTADQRSVVDNYSGYIGYQASRDQSVASTTALSNAWAIGKNARVGASNSMVLGGTGADAIKVGIGTTTPAYTLDVNGDANVAADSAYKYNGANIATASTTLYNYFLGNAGNLTMTGGYNTATGYRSLYANTTGAYNTATGYGALNANTTGTNSVAFGAQALMSNTTGSSNTAFGRGALHDNVSGAGSVAVGWNSLYSSTASSNIGLGYGAGYGALADNRSVIDTFATFIGTNASRDASIASTTVLTNITAIGKNATVAQSNSIVLGGTGADAVNVGIGTTSPSSLLAIAGGSLDITAANTSGVLGSELITATNNRDFSSANNWSGTNWSVGGGVATHTAGNNTYSLANTYLSAAPVAGNYYQINFSINTTVSGFTGLSVSFGGTAAYVTYGAFMTGLQGGESVIVKAVSNGALTFAPNDATWTGTLDNVSIKQITPASVAQTIRNSNGTTGVELRSGGTGLKNTFFGIDSGLSNTTGSNNASNGYQALMSNTTGLDNVAFGYQSLYSNTTGYSNNAFGYQSLINNTTGAGNIGIGDSSLFYNISGSNNIAMAGGALHSNKTGNNNIANGQDSLYFNSSGVHNLALGFQAGTGDSVFIGEQLNRGSVIDNYSGFIGYNASRDNSVLNTIALNNAWAIGYDATVGQSNAIVLGATSTTANAVNVGIGTAFPSSTLSIAGRGGVNPFSVSTSTGNTLFTILQNGNVGIGTSTPNQTLDVEQTTSGVVARFANSTGYCDINPTTTALVCTSDATLKKDVTTISGALNAITALRGVNFRWLSEDASTPEHLGVIAQEVEQVLPQLVATDSATGKKSVNYIGFVPVLIEAMKDLTNRVSALEAKLAQGVSAGVTYVKDFVVETLTAKKVVTDTLEMKDSATGEVYCVKIANGDWDKTKGACAVTSSNNQASVIESVNTTPAPVEIILNGLNPQNIDIKTTWGDLGATASSTDNHLKNLGITTFVDGVEESVPTLDTSVAGVHKITYKVIDNATGTIYATAERTVNVTDPSAVSVISEAI